MSTMSKGATGDEKNNPKNGAASKAIQPTRPVGDPERKAKDEEARYEAYRDERRSLVESEHTGADQLDKNVLALAGGALAVSLVFLEKIAPEPKDQTLLYLCIGWAALVLSLCAVLSSFLTSQHAFRCQRQILEETFFGDVGENSKTVNYWARRTTFLNWTSIVAFIIGVGMLVVFSTENVRLKLRKSQPNPAAITRGATNEQRSATTNK